MVAVLRSALFNAWFFAMTFVLALGYGPILRVAAPHKVLGLAQLWARLTLGGLRVLCGIRVAVHGREHLPPEGAAALVASQHQSTFDTLIWLVLVPRASYVVKAELARLPLFGPLLRPGGQILVDRTAGAAALRKLVEDAQAAAARGSTIVIFPEGTRTEPGARVPLQPGVAALAGRLGIPLLPVATDAGRYWGRRAFQKRPGTIRVLIGAPIRSDLPRAALLGRLRQAWDELTEDEPAAKAARGQGGAADTGTRLADPIGTAG